MQHHFKILCLTLSLLSFGLILPTSAHATSVSDINQNVTSRFDSDILKMSAILEELKRREGVTSNIVAFGQGNTPIDTAAYYLNYAAEANAYQKIQKYSDNKGGKANLRASLNTLRGKLLRAKSEIKKALDHYER